MVKKEDKNPNFTTGQETILFQAAMILLQNKNTNSYYVDNLGEDYELRLVKKVQ